MKIYKIAQKDFIGWITKDDKVLETPKGHDVLVYEKPSLFGVTKLPSIPLEDYKALALQKGNVAFRIQPAYGNKQTYMAIYGSRDNIRSKSSIIFSLIRRYSVKKVIVNVGGNWESFYIEPEEFGAKYASNRIAQNMRIDKEVLDDRTTYWLMDGGNKVGKLIIQPNFTHEYYIIIAFKVEPNYRGKGYGTMMMKEVLNDSKYIDKSIIVQPKPYSDIPNKDYGKHVENLTSMYQHFGFKPYRDRFLILERNAT